MAKTKIENGKRVWWSDPHPYSVMIPYEVDYRRYKNAKVGEQRFNKSIRWVRDVLVECGFQVPSESSSDSNWEHYHFYYLNSYLSSDNCKNTIKAFWEGGTLVIEMEGRKKRVEELPDLLDTIREVWKNGKVYED